MSTRAPDGAGSQARRVTSRWLILAAFLLTSCAPPVEHWVDYKGQKCLRYAEAMTSETQTLCPVDDEGEPGGDE